MKMIGQAVVTGGLTELRFRGNMGFPLIKEYTMKAYEKIDVHSGNGWPETVPPLTAEASVKAAKRLWKWATKKELPYAIILTSGNRHTWAWYGTLSINHGKGWQDFAHMMSHLIWTRMHPGERPHSKAHARFEARLIKLIIDRGYLTGKLDAKPAAVPPSPAATAERDLARLDARLLAWQRKASRAANAIAKIERERARMVRKLAKAGDAMRAA